METHSACGDVLSLSRSEFELVAMVTVAMVARCWFCGSIAQNALDEKPAAHVSELNAAKGHNVVSGVLLVHASR